MYIHQLMIIVKLNRTMINASSKPEEMLSKIKKILVPYYDYNNNHHIPYSGKGWRVESLANLANHLRFTKLKPSKVVVTPPKRLKIVNSPNIPAIQVLTALTLILYAYKIN